LISILNTPHSVGRILRTPLSERSLNLFGDFGVAGEVGAEWLIWDAESYGITPFSFHALRNCFSLTLPSSCLQHTSTEERNTRFWMLQNVLEEREE